MRQEQAYVMQQVMKIYCRDLSISPIVQFRNMSWMTY